MAAARVTRTDYHAPFRAKLYLSSPPATAVAATSSGGVGAKNAGLDVVRDNWDDSSDDDEVVVAEGGPGNREDEGGERGVPEGDAATGQPQQQGDHQDGGESSHKEEEEETAGGVADEPAASTRTTSTAAAAPAAASLPAAVVAAPATGKRQSKWGNSAIKGRLSRPSDGRATTVEQEAAARRERLEKLRCGVREKRHKRMGGGEKRRAERAVLGADSAQASPVSFWFLLGVLQATNPNPTFCSARRLGQNVHVLF